MKWLHIRGRSARCLLALGGWMIFLAGCHPAASPTSTSAPVVIDFEAAQRQAASGGAAAQKTLGDLYAHGQGVKQDYRQAAHWYRLAADQGLAAAQCNLAALYAAGAIGTNDQAEAVKWYRLAAERGHVDAQYNLAQMLSVGRGARRDVTEALRLYQLAALQGDGLSQYNLARRYREGKDVPADPVQAYVWFTAAAANGISDALSMRTELKKDMARDQVAEAERRIAQLNDQTMHTQAR